MHKFHWDVCFLLSYNKHTSRKIKTQQQRCFWITFPFFSSKLAPPPSVSSSRDASPSVCFVLQGRFPLGLAKSSSWHRKWWRSADDGEEGWGFGSKEGRKLESLRPSLSFWCLSCRREEARAAKDTGEGCWGAEPHGWRARLAAEEGGAVWNTKNTKQRRDALPTNLQLHTQFW